MQIIVKNMNILPISYWAEGRNLFHYTVQISTKKIKKWSSKLDAHYSMQDVLS